jgi:hypothetical protein
MYHTLLTHRENVMKYKEIISYGALCNSYSVIRFSILGSYVQ